MTAPPASVIAIHNLTKTYGRGSGAVKALRGVDLSIGEQEWVSIVGPSGSGKTTLLNIIGALDANYSGSVKVRGAELRTLPDRQLSRFRGETLGFVFQQFNLLPHLSVLENVSVPGFFNNSGARENKRHAVDLLDRVGLSEKIRALPNQLSGGQQQRVAIARALFNRAKILLCDEPTGALDTASGRQVMELFSSLNREEGITLIVVTHQPYISDMSQRIIHLEDGRIARADDTRERRPGEGDNEEVEA